MFQFTLSVCLLLLSGGSIVQAAFVLEISANGTFPSSTPIVALPGSTIEISVFLTQTDGESRLNSRGSGLDGAEFDFDISRPMDITVAGFSFGPRLVNNTTPAVNSEIDAEGAFISLIDDSADGFTGAVVSDDGVNDNSILLTTFTLNVSALARGTYDLNASGLGSNPFAFVLADDLIGFPTPIMVSPGFSQLNVAAVPEPSSMAMLAVVTASGVAWRRRRSSRRAPSID